MSINRNPCQTVGHVALGWESVRDAFERNFIDGLDIGATVAIYYHGEAVVELSGGWENDAKTKPYTNNTLQLTYSTSKGVLAAAVALCVHRGLLNYHDPVSKYWPEFGVNGKEMISVHDLMAHRAGLPAVRQRLCLDDVLNWDRITRLLAAERPFWLPGSQHGYHAVTIGFLAGELVHRVDTLHRTYGSFVRDEIAKHLDAEIYVGVPSEQVEARIAPLIYKPVRFDGVPPLLDEVADLTATCSGAFSDGLTSNIFNEVQFHRAELPAINCVTNARSLARLYAALIGDVDKGRVQRLVDQKTLEQAIACATPPNEPDCTLFGESTRFAMGFQTHSALFNVFHGNVFGHKGMGGSCALAYPARQLAFAYVPNYLDMSIKTIDSRCLRILDVVQRVLDTLENNH